MCTTYIHICIIHTIPLRTYVQYLFVNALRNHTLPYSNIHILVNFNNRHGTVHYNTMWNLKLYRRVVVVVVVGLIHPGITRIPLLCRRHRAINCHSSSVHRPIGVDIFQKFVGISKNKLQKTLSVAHM